ncbi:ATP-binding cassette domain-containing protein [Cupriavidus basilensis]
MKEGKPLLELVEVKKSFRFYARPVDRLKEALLGHKHHRDHLALDRFSLVVRQGESVGVLGRNGAGKSTLLKIIVGVLLPDGGIVRHAGRITGLLSSAPASTRACRGARISTSTAGCWAWTPPKSAARSMTSSPSPNWSILSMRRYVPTRPAW